MKISDLSISDEFKSKLIKSDITTVGQLINAKPHGIKRIPGIGDVSVSYILSGALLCVWNEMVTISRRSEPTEEKCVMHLLDLGYTVTKNHVNVDKSAN